MQTVFKQVLTCIGAGGADTLAHETDSYLESLLVPTKDHAVLDLAGQRRPRPPQNTISGRTPEVQQ
jgi:hypothetical protein